MGNMRLNLMTYSSGWMSILLLIMLNSLNCQSAVLIKDKQWQQGLVLNVLFLDGSPELQQLVKATAPQWLQKNSLSFQFFDRSDKAPSQTHIRISFKLHSGSQLGDHQDYESQYPTMNLLELSSSQISASAAQRLILHEFGHALGFEHEYRNSYWPHGEKAIERIITDCYPKMELIGYSSSAAIGQCKKINSPVNSNLAHLTAYDEYSIMNYPISFVTTDGNNKQIKPATKLSLLDRYAIQQWYAP